MVNDCIIWPDKWDGSEVMWTEECEEMMVAGMIVNIKQRFTVTLHVTGWVFIMAYRPKYFKYFYPKSWQIQSCLQYLNGARSHGLTTLCHAQKATFSIPRWEDLLIWRSFWAPFPICPRNRIPSDPHDCTASLSCTTFWAAIEGEPLS